MKPDTYMKKTLSILAGTAVLTLGSACNYRGNTNGLHWFLDMYDSPSVKAQEEDITTLDAHDGTTRGADTMPAQGGPGSGIRVPAEGSVPRNYQPYPYEQGEIEAAGRELKNPVRPTAAVYARGKLQYEIYCAVCHGPSGRADGPVVPRFPGVLPLVNRPGMPAAASTDWPDGKIFHMITAGRGMMKPYAAQLVPADRWAIVHYVRVLQKTAQEGK